MKDLERACEVIDMSVTAYPNFNLFEGRNKYVATRHLKVLEKSVGIYKEISNFSARVLTQKNLVNDKDNQPIWAGGKPSFDQAIKWMLNFVYVKN